MKPMYPKWCQLATTMSDYAASWKRYSVQAQYSTGLFLPHWYCNIAPVNPTCSPETVTEATQAKLVDYGARCKHEEEKNLEPRASLPITGLKSRQVLKSASQCKLCVLRLAHSNLKPTYCPRF